MDEKMEKILATTHCNKHGGSKFIPCWWLASLDGNPSTLRAVCNERARRAGYKAKINPLSLSVRNRGK